MSADSQLLKKLEYVTRILLDDSRPAHTLRNEIIELRSVLEAASSFSAAAASDIATGETTTQNGVAISPTMAAMCLDDFARTVQFLRGVHAAVKALHSGAPVRVLYAGCGPWASLAVPLLSVLTADDVRFTLLDIHRESVDSVRRIIRTFEMEDRVGDVQIVNALEHVIDADSRPDIILIEMLRAALESEPQVAVSAHFRKQAPDALMLPEEVAVDLALVNPSKEFSFGEGAVPERDRVLLDRLFTLSGGSFDPGTREVTFRLPAYDERFYRPTLLTTVRIFGEIAFRDYDSGITSPVPVGLRDLKSGDLLTFTYQLGERPGIRVSRS